MFKSHIFNWTFEPYCVLMFSNNRCRKRDPRFVTSRGNAQNNSLKRYRLRPCLWHCVNGGKSSSKHISKNTPRCLKATYHHRTTAKNQITVHTDQIKSFKAIFSTCKKNKKSQLAECYYSKKICFIWLGHWRCWKHGRIRADYGLIFTVCLLLANERTFCFPLSLSFLKAIKPCAALRAIMRPSGPLVYCIGWALSNPNIKELMSSKCGLICL